LGENIVQGAVNPDEYYVFKPTLKKGPLLVRGKSVGKKIANGKARVIPDVVHLSLFNVGEILIADTTTPDWEPVMKTAAAIVTNRGGRICHAAIVSR